MKIAIIYYTRTGHTGATIRRIQESLPDDDIDVILLEAVKQPGFLGSGMHSGKQTPLPLKNEAIDVGGYDHVILGGPVWNGKPNPYLKTFLNTVVNGEGKPMSCFLCCVSKPEGNGPAIDLLKENAGSAGFKVQDTHMILRMKKGEVIDGEEGFQPFVDSIK